jgi:hypothetical protein
MASPNGPYDEGYNKGDTGYGTHGSQKPKRKGKRKMSPITRDGAGPGKSRAGGKVIDHPMRSHIDPAFGAHKTNKAGSFTRPSGEAGNRVHPANHGASVSEIAHNRNAARKLGGGGKTAPIEGQPSRPGPKVRTGASTPLGPGRPEFQSGTSRPAATQHPILGQKSTISPKKKGRTVLPPKRR